MYDHKEIVEIYSHFSSESDSCEVVKSELGDVLGKLSKDVKEFHVCTSDPFPASASPLDDLLLLACQKSSIGIVKDRLSVVGSFSKFFFIVFGYFQYNIK